MSYELTAILMFTGMMGLLLTGQRVFGAIGFIAVIGIRTGYTLYVDIAIALGLVGFLATVAFARFVMARGRTETESGAETEAKSGSKS